ncbi:uncharacterized protein LOC26513655 [Drosophila ananassae]|uniref:uncharacterized protein LOC26513655 n=1 Tax=Drosophila ananassae TaxID=7217 RepID=UPI0013A5E6A5|nr:uncharacterized protein LOC26513655 [Drosophila ananassae]
MLCKVVLVVCICSLALARGTPQSPENQNFCEFLANFETYRGEVWTRFVEILKATLTRMVSAVPDCPDCRQYVAFLQDYISRGDAINSSSSTDQKIEYAKGFSEAMDRRSSLDLSSYNNETALKVAMDYATQLFAEFSKFQEKLIAAESELKRKVGQDVVSREVEFFELLRTYGVGTLYRITRTRREVVANRILSFKQQFQCA